MRVADLLAALSWDFFDILHLHTVELATLQELRELADRLARLGKPLVVTVHDLRPNVEEDTDAFRRKTTLVLERAAVAVTLTRAAADRLAVITQVSRPLEIVPHGQALAPGALAEGGITKADGGFAVFGALRPNRDLYSVVTAWRSLLAPRPSLRVLLRSVSAADRHRNAELIDFLERTARSDRNCTLEVTEGLVPDKQLVAWLAGTSVLVLPYRSTTHSGQLELACDLGLPVLAPDEPILRDQLVSNGCGDHPADWFPYEALRTRRLADHLRRALELRPRQRADQHAFHDFRRAEHARLVTAHARIYGISAPSSDG
jgi:glycosyltransferase involved in cell wall biosynthesis